MHVAVGAVAVDDVAVGAVADVDNGVNVGVN